MTMGVEPAYALNAFSPLCGFEREFCTRCRVRITDRRAERAKKILRTSQGLRRDIKGGALD